MKVSRVTRYPYLWHNITVTDDVNSKNSFLCYLLGDIFQVILYLIPIYNRKNCCPVLFGRNCTLKFIIQSGPQLPLQQKCASGNSNGNAVNVEKSRSFVLRLVDIEVSK
jgi:hypothetical protein